MVESGCLLFKGGSGRDYSILGISVNQSLAGPVVRQVGKDISKHNVRLGG